MDEELRRFEREERHSGAHLRALLRAGSIPQKRVKLAAELGHRGARDAAGITRSTSLDRVARGLDAGTLRAWACDCAEHVLPAYRQVAPDDDRPARALDVARRTLSGTGRSSELEGAFGQVLGLWRPMRGAFSGTGARLALQTLLEALATLLDWHPEARAVAAARGPLFQRLGDPRWPRRRLAELLLELPARFDEVRHAHHPLVREYHSELFGRSLEPVPEPGDP